MNHRIVTSTLALALTFGITSASNAAVLSGPGSPTTTATNTHTKVKLVSFNMRNDSASALVIQVGERQMTIEPGKTSALKVQEGTQIVAVNATGHISAGAVLATVNKDLSGNTIAVN